MSTGGFGAAQAPSLNNVIEQKLRAESIVKTGAGWFLWVAGLSMVNSVLSLSGAGFRFIFGLGIAQIVDALAHQAGSSGVALDLIINGFVAGVFVVFWNFARQGQNWAFLVGMALYAVDGLILITFKDFLGVAFHGYVLFRIYSALKILPVLHRLQQATAPADAPIVPR
jgi:hypothetical protein